MSVASTLSMAATIVSGLVSLIVLFGIVLDAITKGWVRSRARRWLGISDLREDHSTTQVFLLDLGDGYNDLAETVCEEHDIDPENRPDGINVSRYQRLLNDRQVERGDFVRSDD